MQLSSFPIEEVFRTLLDSLPISVFIKDAEDHFRYLMTNTMMNKLAGRLLEGKLDEDAFPPAIAADIRSLDEFTMTQEGLTERTIDVNGRLHHNLKKAFRLGNGHRLLIGVAVDVTDIEFSHRQAHDAKLLFETLLDQLPVGVVVKDADNGYRVTKCNKAFGQIANKPLEEILGRTTSELKFTNLDGSSSIADDQRVMETGKAFEFLERSPKENGRHQTLIVKKFPIHLQDRSNLLIGTFSDITTLHNLYEAERIVNTVLSQGMLEQDVTKIFGNILGLLHEKNGCDAIALFSYHESEKRYEPEIDARMDGNMSKLFAEEEWQKAMQKRHPALTAGKQIAVPDCESSAFAGMWRKLGMKSVHATPITLNKTYWGFLLAGFSRNKRIFSEIDQSVMSSIAKLVALYLARQRQERILHHAMQMEAMAMLASGVAHDFNNILQVILGNMDLALADAPEGSPLRTDLEEVRKAAEEAKDITGGLLAFARKQQTSTKIVQELNILIRELLPICKRLAGKKVEICFTACEKSCPIFIDRSQISQILTNLVVNARDAIATANRQQGQIILTLDQTRGEAPGKKAGAFARLTVADNGCGMDEKTQAHIFDAFFTTKPDGKGTGLGLSTVRGIVEKNHGTISVESLPGESTTFTILLPLCEKAQDSAGGA